MTFDAEKANKPIIAVTALLLQLGTLAGLVITSIKFLRPILSEAKFIGPEEALALSIAIPVVVAVVLLWMVRQALNKESRLIRRERFDLRVRNRSDLSGRDGDVDDLRSLLGEFSLLFLDGESGSGKSSLVAHGLVPALLETKKILPVLITEYGNAWDASLTHKTYERIVASLSEAELAGLPGVVLDSSGTRTAAQLNELLQAISTRLHKTIFFIFDQFDDYQTVYRDRFQDVRKAWISAATLKNISPFWCVVDEARRAGMAKVMVVVRSDASGGLHSVRFEEAVGARTLLRLDTAWLRQLLLQLDKDDGNGPVISDSESGWTELRKMIERDLGRGREILPQQLRISLLGLRELRVLTPREYRRHGGVAGAEALYIHEGIRWAALACGRPEAEIRAMLMQFVERGPSNVIKTRLKAETDLAQSIPDAALRAKALDRLKRDEIVRQSRDEDNLPCWQLDHDYLANAVIAETRLQARYTTLLRDASEAFDEAGTSWIQRFKVLLPITTQIAIAWHKVRAWRSFTYQPYRRLAVLSLLRAAPLTILAAAAASWIVWTNSDAYQIRTIVALGMELKTTNDQTYPSLTEALAISGRTEDAIAHAKSSQIDDVKGDRQMSLAAYLAQRGEKVRALQLINDRVAFLSQAARPANLAHKLLVLSALLELVRRDPNTVALPVLERLRKIAFARDETDVYTAMKIAEIYSELQQRADADGELEQADAELVKSYSDQANSRYSSMAHTDLALAYFKAGNIKKALAAMVVTGGCDKDSKAFLPQEPMVTMRYAQAYKTMGNAKDHLTCVELAIAAAAALEGSQGNAVAVRSRPSLTLENPQEFVSALVEAGRSDLVPSFTDRDERLPVRAFCYIAAADTAFTKAATADASRFMRLAETLGQREQNTVPRANLLLRVALGYKKINESENYRRVLLAALSAARTASEDYDSAGQIDGAAFKLDILTRLAIELRQANLKEADLALTEAADLQTKTAGDPSRYLPRLAYALAAGGKLKAARLTAERVKNTDQQATALANALFGHMMWLEPTRTNTAASVERVEQWVLQDTFSGFAYQ